ncbi:NAD-dependent epimerase/dehydratase family protein [Pontixanthobacter aestiaquae]|uniref:NAD-dependent epimerase/dehydratase family protein n=1 Tax=Pontixanthobacter aestiaquae TaxID=1509367 RepID=A0A844ZDT0_9SPHN|nr:NAD-dependent epimerase/dehydratase family protein [Pontixanthobacter aestiaquae]MDN3645061.1 NAD-dependent epimerase/dehydratase family protein [Pontixanthobacter aestiaquae]MXO83939.1 NAD-dependent epimerase/dehydratase family protein [Pontixanthobacter aestiaquae]
MLGPGSSVAIIGAGQIGYATAMAFIDRGWSVTVYARTAPSWPLGTSKLRRGLIDKALKWRPFDAAFRQHDASENPAPNADLVLDTIAFDAADVERYDPNRVGRLIAISSASVYCDQKGRTLDEAAQNGFPEFGGAVSENQSTVAPGPETYSTRKIRMEQRAAKLFGDRATILRPCAIYGEWSRHPREWWFIKRLLDGRSQIPLIHGGLSQFQTTSVEDIAYFAVDAAEQSLGGVYNVADEGCPTVAEIGEILSDPFDNPPELVPLDGAGLVGRTPWSVAKPFSISNARMVAAGYDLPSTYGSGAPQAARWLRELNPADWQTAFPQLAAYPWDLFDYDTEDSFLKGR